MKNRVFIIGGGPSLHGFNFNKLINEDTIAVNRSIFDLPTANYFITMDYTFMRRMGVCGPKIIHKRLVDFTRNPAEKVFVVGYDEGRFSKNHEFEIVDAVTGLVYDLHLFNKVVWANARGGIGATFDDFRSSSDSGYSALQLSIILGYKEVYLLGMDFTVHKSGMTHYHHDYGVKNRTYQQRLDWFYTEYDRAFKEIYEKFGTRVFSCSMISKLNHLIPYVNPASIL